MDLQTGLVEIGFTEYEAKVYLALLRESPATGYQISKKSGVPRSMVYEALGRLSTRGAVLETIEDRATLYRPLPPHTLLDRHDEEHRRLLEGLREGLHAIYTAPQEERVWSISGRRSVLAYAAQMIRASQVELFLLLNDADLDDLHDEIAASGQRSVAISALLTGERSLEYGNVAYHPPLESEMEDLIGMLMVIADNVEALVGSTTGEARATTTRDRNMVMVARQYVWTEFSAQRIYARLGPEMLKLLDPEDRRIFESRARR